MPRETGKRFEWEIAESYGDPFFIALQDYDWADEVLHAQIGRRWLRDEYPGAAERLAAGNEIMERWHVALERAAPDPARPVELVARLRRAGARSARRRLSNASALSADGRRASSRARSARCP